jgi:hypothetical protein
MEFCKKVFCFSCNVTPHSSDLQPFWVSVLYILSRIRLTITFLGFLFCQKGIKEAQAFLLSSHLVPPRLPPKLSRHLSYFSLNISVLCVAGTACLCKLMKEVGRSKIVSKNCGALSRGADPLPLSLLVVKADRNHLNEESTPLLPAGIGE